MDPIDIYLTANCPYCTRAKILLDQKKVAYTELRVDQDNDLLQEMYQRSNQFTVPQIFIGKFHIGGFDDMYLLEVNGELDPLLFPDNKEINT